MKIQDLPGFAEGIAPATAMRRTVSGCILKNRAASCRSRVLMDLRSRVRFPSQETQNLARVGDGSTPKQPIKNVLLTDRLLTSHLLSLGYTSSEGMWPSVKVCSFRP